jgi:hypothetical protein
MAGVLMTTCEHCHADLTSHPQILLHALREGGPMTKHEVRDQLGIENVGARIADLRRNHEIETKMIKVLTRYGTEAEVAQYRYVKPREQMEMVL